MACEQSLQPTALSAGGEGHELLLERNGGRRVVARPVHVLHAVVVGDALLVAPELPPGEMQTEPGGADDRPGVLRVVDRQRHAEPGQAKQQLSLESIGAVLGRGMHDLVAEYRRELRFVLQFHQEAAMDADLAAGQRPGVRRAVVDHDEFVGEIPVADGGDAVTHRGDVFGDSRVHPVLSAAQLLKRFIFALTDRDLVCRREQRQLALTGHGIDGTARRECQQRQEQHGPGPPVPQLKPSLIPPRALHVVRRSPGASAFLAYPVRLPATASRCAPLPPGQARRGTVAWGGAYHWAGAGDRRTAVPATNPTMAIVSPIAAATILNELLSASSLVPTASIRPPSSALTPSILPSTA